MAFNSFGATSSFGGSAANSSFGFGSQSSTNSGFGFGSKTASGFGSPSTGGFGTPSTVGGSSNMFGQPASNVFGSPASGTGFTKSFSTNTSVTNNLGGLGNTGAFGSSPGGGFGTSAFGAKPAGSPSTPFGGGGAFGATAQPSAFGGGGGAFGSTTTGSTFGSSAFGAPAATSAFGAPAASASPFGAAASAFGGAPAPAFGTSAAPAFGAAAAPAFGSTGTSAFGGGSAFGGAATTQPAAGGFGAFGSGSAFGQPAASSGAFGSTGLGGGSPFGAGAGATGFGATAGATTGTGNPKFSPLPIQETVNKAGHNQVTTLSLQVITGMAAYNTKSVEELRFEDYQRGNKTGNAVAGGAFGLGAATSTNPFGAPAAAGATGGFGSGAFGAPAAAPASSFSFGAPAAAPAAANPFGGAGATSAFGAASAPSFGSAFGATAAPAFGASAAPAFGAAAAPAFGSTGTSAFGSPSGSTFGSVGASSTTGSAFGSAASPFGGLGGSTSTFGSSAFGAPAAGATGAAPAFGSAFGSGGGGAFGQTQPATSAFGAPAAAPAASSGFSFGSPAGAAAPAFGAPAGTTSAFGQPAAGGLSFGSAFGSTAATAAPTSAFGSTGFGSSTSSTSGPSFSFGAATAAPASAGSAGFSFGATAAAPSATASTGLFGSTGGAGGFGSFGAPAANVSAGGFGSFGTGATGATTGFGLGTSGGFGQAQPSGFGAFGSPQPQTASGFGGFGAAAAGQPGAMSEESLRAQLQAQLEQYLARQEQMRDVALKLDLMRRQQQSMTFRKSGWPQFETVEVEPQPSSSVGSFKNYLTSNSLKSAKSPPEAPVYPRSSALGNNNSNISSSMSMSVSTPGSVPRIMETSLVVPVTPLVAPLLPSGSKSKLQLSSLYSQGMVEVNPLADLPPAQYFNGGGDKITNTGDKTPATTTDTTPLRLSGRGGLAGEATGLTPHASVLTPLASSGGAKKGAGSGISTEDDHQRHISFHLSPKDQTSHVNHLCAPSNNPPTLTKPGYFTTPDMEVLSSYSDEELSKVKDFTVFRPNYGSIKWLGETDIRSLNLDACVRIDKKEVFVYENMDTPLVGTQLNKTAVVTLQNVFPKAGSSDAKKAAYVEKLKEFCSLNDAAFLSYDATSGDWSFQVKHFSRYGLDENFEDQLDQPDIAPAAETTSGESGVSASDVEINSTTSSSPSPSKVTAAAVPTASTTAAATVASVPAVAGSGLNSLPDSGRKIDSGRKSVSTGSQDDVVIPPVNGGTFDPFHADSYSVVMSPPDFYQQFWERTYSLFYDVCDPYKNCDECLCAIEDLAIFVRQSSGQVSTPVVALALDVVVQRAMYELSDKTTKRQPEAAGASATPSTSVAPVCSVANIEHCIAIMTQVISPLIAKLGDNLKSPIPLNDKVSTLTRQLQELIAWSSFHSQVVVPDSFPKYNVGASESESAAAGGDSSGTTKLHCYPPPNNPSMSSYSNPTVRVLDDTISNLVREVSVANAIPVDLVHNVQARLHKILNGNSYGLSPGRGGSGGPGLMAEIGIHVCGAVQLSLMDAESKKELDFVTSSVPFNFNFHNLPLEAKRSEMKIHQALLSEKNSIEKIVGSELLADGALKHFRACLKDFRNLAAEFLTKLSEFVNSMGPSMAYESDVYGRVGGGSSGGGSGGPRGGGGYNDFSYIDSTYQTLIHAIRSNVDIMRAQSDGLVDRYTSMKDAAQRQNPNISVLTKRLEAIQMQLDYKENERFSAIRRAMTTIEKQLKESGYNYVRVITHKTRFMHLKFIYQEYGMDVIPCNLIVHNVLPLQMSDLLEAYMSIDKSGKIRDFIHVVKLFAKSHRIADPSSGFLSSTAWHVMAIHVLLHFEFLPNLHMDKIYRPDSEGSGGSLSPPNTHRSAYDVGGFDPRGGAGAVGGGAADALQDLAFATPRSMYLPAKYVTKIENTSIIEMLDIFFRYYVEQIDVFRDVITLKDKGMVLKKTDWARAPATNAVLWRLSIEDPFDHISSQHPYDLGSTLSRPGQLTTYKALRRAIYGIHSIVSVGIDSCFLNVKKFFSRTDLITLARKSDYLGAVITETPVWTSVNPGPERSIIRSQPYGNVSLTETVDLTPLASLSNTTTTAYKAALPASVHHGMVPKLSLNFHPSQAGLGGAASHDGYSARSAYESLSARGMGGAGMYQSQGRDGSNTARSMYSVRSGMGGPPNDPYLVSPRQDPYGGAGGSGGGMYHQLQQQQQHQMHGPPHLQHPGLHHQQHHQQHQQQHQHHSMHASHSQHSHISQQQHQHQLSGYSQEQWHHPQSSAPNSARYSQASFDTYDDYSDMDNDYLSPRRYPSSYSSSNLHSNSGSQLLSGGGGGGANSRGIPLKNNNFVPRLPLNNASTSGGMVADLRFQGAGNPGPVGGPIISPRMDEYRSQQPPQPLSARVPGQSMTPQQQQQKSLRSDAAVFMPQGGGGGAVGPANTGLSPKKPVIPMIPLSQLGAGSTNSGNNANLQSDRFLDLSSMPRVSPGRYPEGGGGGGGGGGYGNNNSNSAAAGGVDIGAGPGSARDGIPLHPSLTPRLALGGPQNSEFQEIMEKMSSDALNISQTITSARSTSSSATVMSALSSANSGTTTLDRFSLSSNSTLTPRGTTIEYSDYRQYVVPPAHGAAPGLATTNKTMSPYAAQHLTPRGGASTGGGSGV